VQSIVPKGYSINHWPRPMSSNQRAVSQVTATLAASETSIDNTHNQIAKQINTYAKFFVPHFGLDPLDHKQPKSLVSTYFPPNHTVKQGGGTGNTLSIAQELMEFKNPSAADAGMDIWSVVAVLNGILRIPYQEEKTAVLVDKQMEFVEKAVFDLEVRPTRDSLVAALGLKVPEGVNVLTIGEMKRQGPYPISNYTQTQGFREMEDWKSAPVTGGHQPATTIQYKFGYARLGHSSIALQKRHHTGPPQQYPPYTFDLAVNEIINHYEEVYQVNNPAATPAMFWQANSRKRIGVEMDFAYGQQNYTVKIFNVDPATGAPRDRGTAVATAPKDKYEGNPGLLLAKVRQALFPEVYLLSDQVSMEGDARQEHYKEALLYAKNLWEGIPDKAKTPVTCVIHQRYQLHKNLDYQGVTPKPTKEDSMPLQSMTMYLQPTGIEDAMRRVLDINHPQNAIKKWFGYDTKGPLSSYRQSSNGETRYPNYIHGIKMEDWNNAYFHHYNKVIQVLYDIIDSPHLYAEGINGKTITNAVQFPGELIHRAKMFGKEHPLASPTGVRGPKSFIDYAPRVSNAEYSLVLGQALRIMELADWPQAAPQKMFDAPVDDEGDLNMLMSMFRNYLNKETIIAPGQMYVPEGFNGLIVSEVVLAKAYEGTLTEEQQELAKGILRNFEKINPDFSTPEQTGIVEGFAAESLSDVVWEFHKTVPAVTGPLAYKPSGMLVYFDSWSDVNKMSRYHQGAKTIITSRTVGRTSTFAMPRVITPSAKVLETLQDNTVTAMFGQIEASKGIIGITAGLGLAYYIVHRGRVWPFTLL